MLSTVEKISAADIERLPHYRKATQAGEYSSACPFCNEGRDRFRYWPEVGNFWCRRCDAKGFVDEVSSLQFNPAQYEEWKRHEAERKEKERLAQLSAIDRLNEQNNVARYHHQLTDRSWWYDKGLTDKTINLYQLGYTTNCPTAKGRESYTIPVSYRGRLYNIRHRLANGNNGNKYRPEMAGLPATLFNADILDDDTGFVSEVVLVEGEIKTMVLSQYSFDAVGVMGANSFKAKWVEFFKGKRVYVAFDPGADEQAARVWQQLGEAGVNTKLCCFPVKPDDFFVVYGGTPSQFYKFLMLGLSYQ